MDDQPQRSYWKASAAADGKTIATRWAVTRERAWLDWNRDHPELPTKLEQWERG
jgi:hypothetical protein